MGVKSRDVLLPDDVAINGTVRCKSNLANRSHPPIARTLGPRILGYSPVYMDSLDGATQLDGAKYRFCRQHVEPDPILLNELTEFTDAFLRKYLVPLPAGEITFEDYISQTHYTIAKKDQMRDIFAKMTGPPKKVRYSSFGKTETMNIPQKDSADKYKHVRCINGPDDYWKCYAGPYVHAVEKQVCKLHWFAKYIPVCERARAIHDVLSDFSGPYYVTDYTSFESSFVPQVVNALEVRLYRYMLSAHKEAADVICRQITGKHVCRFRDFTIRINGVRMSGDPNTSLGNGFSNLVLMAFNAHKQHARFDGFVEGDDGLFAFDREVDFDIIQRLGFQLKLEPHETLYTTSFCGLMLSRSLASFADPRYNLVKFGWSSSKLRNSKESVRLGLLRAKALSLLYCNPRCPILTQLAVQFIKLTEGYEAVFEPDFWSRRVASETLKNNLVTQGEYRKGISTADRVDFDTLYNVSPVLQCRIEHYISTLTSIGPLSHPSISELLAGSTIFHDFDERFCGPLAAIA